MCQGLVFRKNGENKLLHQRGDLISEEVLDSAAVLFQESGMPFSHVCVIHSPHLRFKWGLLLGQTDVSVEVEKEERKRCHKGACSWKNSNLVSSRHLAEESALGRFQPSFPDSRDRTNSGRQ